MSDRRLMLEMNAAKMLRSMLLEFEDEQLIADAIEGECNVREALHAVFLDTGLDEATLVGLKSYIGQLQERCARIERRLDKRKEAMQKALELAEIPRLEWPEGSIGLRRVPPGLLVDDEK